MKDCLYILVDFGGPRTPQEIEPFLRSLLLDEDVVRTNLIRPFHRYLFQKIAKNRAKKVALEYEEMGGASPIFETTERVKNSLKAHLGPHVLAFHRYIPQTHPEFIQQVLSNRWDEIRVVPLFPQFSYATTGSCARYLATHLPDAVVQKMRWCKSYPAFAPFIQTWKEQIAQSLETHPTTPEKTLLLYSCHGVPEKFIASQDLYLDECRLSYEKLRAHFPRHPSKLCFQSQFGKDQWIGPSTQQVCQTLDPDSFDAVFVVPLSFTSDHIETLVEIEQAYLPLIRERGMQALRVPCFNASEPFVQVLAELFASDDSWTNTQMLIRPKGCRSRCSTCKSRCRW